MKKNIDMTEGSLLPELCAFTLPLILGNFFQLLYNMVDTIVIGRFAGSQALAAVGTSDPIMTILIWGVSGVCVGSSVLMSNFFGAKEYDRLKDELKTTIVMGLLAAVVVLLAGMATCNLLLHVLNVPDDVFADAGIYLRIIYLGMPFTCLYNIYSAALRSIGDSRTPLRYLMVSNVLNMVLDILLVAGFHMGVAGAGLATVVAEGLSAVLCIIYVQKQIPLLQFPIAQLAYPDKELAKKTISYGGITALQQCAQPIGNLMIQGSINTLGAASIAALHAVRKIEDIGLVPGRTISTSIMTCTAQNRGAKNQERMEKGFRIGMGMELFTGLLLFPILFVLKRPLMLLFTTDEAIIAEGLSYYAIMAGAYWLSSFTNGTQGYFRGIGAMTTTLFGTLSQITVRVIVTFLLIPRIGIQGIGYACIAGWVFMLVWQTPYRIYRRNRLQL